jgi:hypothetical protein
MMIDKTVDRAAVESVIAAATDDTNPFTADSIRDDGPWTTTLCRVFEEFENRATGLVSVTFDDGTSRVGGHTIEVTPSVQTGTTEHGDTYFDLIAVIRRPGQDMAPYFVSAMYSRASEAAEEIAELDGFTTASDEGALYRLIIEWTINKTVETTVGLHALLAG